MSLSRLLTALFVVSSILFGLHFYIWTKLVRDAQLVAPYRGLVTYGLVSLGALIPLVMAGSRALPRSLVAPFAWVVYVWMGLIFFLFFLSLGADLLVLGGRLVGRIAGLPPDPERRVFLGKAVALAVVGGSGILGGLAMSSALGAVAVKRVPVRLAKLPPQLAGYTIVQVSDIHVGPTIGRAFIEQIVARINALKPDLVAITGDLVDGSVAELGHLVEPLRELSAKDGVYFVTGNHEYYSGADEWIAFLGTLGVKVLRNERVTICAGPGGACFDLAGVDDWTAKGFGKGHGADLPRALEGRDPGRPLVLLAHQPKAAREAAALGVDLQLSGHTHGGQLWPFNWLVKLEQPFVSGLYALRDTQIYVSNGTGYWGPPMRLGAPAEITRLELSCT